MNKDIKEILYSQTEISEAIKKMGAKISKDYAGKNPLVVCILKGALVFTADLIREIDTYCEVDFMDVSSYGDKTFSSGKIRIEKDLDKPVDGRDLIIVDDIMDTGKTFKSLANILIERNAKSVKICTLFDKPSRRTENVHADYLGLEVPNEFLVGYGLDYAGRYRNLPYVGILKPEIYNPE